MFGALFDGGHFRHDHEALTQTFLQLGHKLGKLFGGQVEALAKFLGPSLIAGAQGFGEVGVQGFQEGQFVE